MNYQLLRLHLSANNKQRILAMEPVVIMQRDMWWWSGEQIKSVQVWLCVTREAEPLQGRSLWNQTL